MALTQTTREELATGRQCQERTWQLLGLVPKFCYMNEELKGLLVKKLVSMEMLKQLGSSKCIIA